MCLCPGFVFVDQKLVSVVTAVILHQLKKSEREKVVSIRTKSLAEKVFRGIAKDAKNR